MISCILLRIWNFPSQPPLSGAPKNFEVFSNGRRLSADELPVQRAAAEKRAILAQELEIRFKEGDAKVVLANALPLFDDTGAVRGSRRRARGHHKSETR